MNLIIQYGLLGLVLGLGLGLGLGFILHCKIWRPLALPYMCPQPFFLPVSSHFKLVPDNLSTLMYHLLQVEFRGRCAQHNSLLHTDNDRV